MKIPHVISSRPVTRPVIRRFTCECCGKEVKITNPRDKRDLFCSYTCKSLFYLSHPEIKPSHF